ncbi:MAG: hypothetical protein RLZZ59_49 [Pseudomonadota bacterium]|jgi:cell division protein FtsL
MIYRYSTVIITLLVFIAGYLLFSMKREVEGLHFEFGEVQKQIKNEKNTIGLLKAEYSYLANPQRIRKLAAQYLSLATVDPEQMINDPLVTQDVSMVSANLSDDAKTVVQGHSQGLIKISNKSSRWRYKNMNGKYVRKASARRGHE